jgi:hypothetical protein
MQMRLISTKSIASFKLRNLSQAGMLRICLISVLLILYAGVPAWAHIGPPFPIMQNRKIGSLNVEVWSNPDVGTGSFWIVIDPPKGSSIPPDLKVRVAVQPVSGRLPEKIYDAWRDQLRNRVEFKAEVPFDQEETWRVRILLASSQVSGETGTDVAVTPTILGRWSLLLFLLPFLGIGMLWFKAASAKLDQKKRRRMKKAQESAIR